MSCSRIVEVGGIAVVTGVAFVASIRDVRARWPAIVALVGAAPMGFRLLQAIPDIGLLVRLEFWHLDMIFFGSAATIAVALYAACRRIPAPPADEPIAPARVVD